MKTAIRLTVCIFMLSSGHTYAAPPEWTTDSKLKPSDGKLGSRIPSDGNKAIMRPPTTKAFTDDKDSMLVRDLKYMIGTTTSTITVPKGFVTDYASIPQTLWSFGLSPHGRYSKAAIIHDFLYWTQVCTKEQADKILVIAMKESNVGAVKESEIYLGVKTFGMPSWNANADQRKRFLPRIIPIEYRDFPGDVTWNSYRSFLVSKGVKDPVFESDDSFCKYGNSTDVPNQNDSRRSGG